SRRQTPPPGTLKCEKPRQGDAAVSQSLSSRGDELSTLGGCPSTGRGHYHLASANVQGRMVGACPHHAVRAPGRRSVAVGSPRSSISTRRSSPPRRSSPSTSPSSTRGCCRVAP